MVVPELSACSMWNNSQQRSRFTVRGSCKFATMILDNDAANGQSQFDAMLLCSDNTLMDDNPEAHHNEPREVSYGSWSCQNGLRIVCGQDQVVFQATRPRKATLRTRRVRIPIQRSQPAGRRPDTSKPDGSRSGAGMNGMVNSAMLAKNAESAGFS